MNTTPRETPSQFATRLCPISTFHSDILEIIHAIGRYPSPSVRYGPIIPLHWSDPLPKHVSSHVLATVNHWLRRTRYLIPPVSPTTQPR